MIGIIGAMDHEVRLLVEQIKDKKENRIGSYVFYSGTINLHDVVVVKCGIGKVASAVCATLMTQLYHPNFILNTGIAGGLEGLHTGDLLLPTELCYADVDATVFGYRKGQVPGMPEFFPSDLETRNKIIGVLQDRGYDYVIGKILTSDSFITSLDQIKIDYTLPCGCEMEGASIAQACYLTHTKFVSIRFISDVIGTEEQVENYKQFEEEMAVRSARICTEIINALK